MLLYIVIDTEVTYFTAKPALHENRLTNGEELTRMWVGLGWAKTKT